MADDTTGDPTGDTGPIEDTESGPVAPKRRLAKLTAIPVLGAILFVILYGAVGMGRDTTPRVHDLRNVDGCRHCHVADRYDELTIGEPALCYSCHADAIAHGQSHPIAVAVTEQAHPPLPLFDGKMQCSTCHDPHGKIRTPLMLRIVGSDLCVHCHQQKAGTHHGH